MKLYNYFRSSASYRVRIAMHLKGLDFEYIPVHLVRNGGEQFSNEYLQKNPMAQTPCLEHDGKFISQSMAIMFYLDEVRPVPRLFPTEPYERAKVIEACEIINSGIQPLQNLSVFNELGSRFNANQEDKNSWAQFWILKGLKAFEKIIAPTAGKFCFGDQPGAADCFLVPQLFASRRMGADINQFPTLLRIEENAKELLAFQKAEPARQIDYAP